MQDIIRRTGITIFALYCGATPTLSFCEAEPNSIEIGAMQENLDQGFADWQNLDLVASHKWAPRQTIYGELHDFERFSVHDKQLVAGYYHPLGDNTTGLIEFAASADHHFLPEWSILGQVEQQLSAGWGLQLGWRHNEYPQTTSDLVVTTVERYWLNYRAAYSLYLGKPEGAGAASSHRVTFDYYFADRNSMGVAFSQGKEVENVGGVITTDVRSVALTGHYWFAPTWSVAMEASRHGQGDLYVRKGIRLGLRRTF
jgi:YaiO family outer membrane protein